MQNHFMKNHRTQNPVFTLSYSANCGADIKTPETAVGRAARTRHSTRGRSDPRRFCSWERVLPGWGARREAAARARLYLARA